jgi:hypothetical protein
VKRKFWQKEPPALINFQKFALYSLQLVRTTPKNNCRKISKDCRWSICCISTEILHNYDAFSGLFPYIKPKSSGNLRHSTKSHVASKAWESTQSVALPCLEPAATSSCRRIVGRHGPPSSTEKRHANSGQLAASVSGGKATCPHGVVPPRLWWSFLSIALTIGPFQQFTGACGLFAKISRIGRKHQH